MFPAERDEQGGFSYEVCVQDGVLRRKSQDVFSLPNVCYYSLPLTSENTCGTIIKILQAARHNEHIIYDVHLNQRLFSLDQTDFTWSLRKLLRMEIFLKITG